MKRYDVIVLGAGGIGSAALYQLARRGAKVLGIDRFSPPHDRGSSHGQTRVIRQAYFEHPDYVPLLLESYRLWHELEQQTGQHLLHQIGLVEIGPEDGVVVPGVLSAAAQHGLTVESLSANEIVRHWPGLRVSEPLVGVYEPTAGYLLVEACVEAHLTAAREAGAELLFNTEVAGWTADANGITVRTANGTIGAERIVITAGAWAGQVLADLNVRLTARRKSLFWFATEAAEYKAASGMPVYLFELADGVFYGFPRLDKRGVKFAEHSGGRVVENPPDVDREVVIEEERRLVNVLRRLLPGVSTQMTDHAVCLYTMSPDEHFVVDRHPAHANVVFAAGLSGHGFKFAPVLGAALADLVIEGRTTLPIGFLSSARFVRS
jgi:monomeric sarcosine oxidase